MECESRNISNKMSEKLNEKNYFSPVCLEMNIKFVYLCSDGHLYDKTYAKLLVQSLITRQKLVRWLIFKKKRTTS